MNAPGIELCRRNYWRTDSVTSPAKDGYVSPPSDLVTRTPVSVAERGRGPGAGIYVATPGSLPRWLGYYWALDGAWSSSNIGRTIAVLRRDLVAGTVSRSDGHAGAAVVQCAPSVPDDEVSWCI